MTDVAKHLIQVDGVQFFTDNAGNAGLSQRGLAKLCGINAASAKRDIELIISKVPSAENDGEAVEMYTLKGSEDDQNYTKVYNSTLCVKIIKYAAFTMGKPEALITASKFMEIGFTKWVQNVTGYKEPETTLDPLEQAYIAMGQMIQIRKYGQDNPGFISEVNAIVESKNVLDGLLTVREMAALRGKSFTTGQSQTMGRSLTACFKKNKQSKLVPTVKVKYRDDSGRMQNRVMNAYPLSMIDTFDSLCIAQSC